MRIFRFSLPPCSLERANRSIKLVTRTVSDSPPRNRRGLEKETKSVRVPFASRYYPWKVEPRSDWCAFLDPVLDGMDFSTSIFGPGAYPCNELGRVCSLLILRSIDTCQSLEIILYLQISFINVRFNNIESDIRFHNSQGFR